MMEIREVAVCVFDDPEAAREAMRELQGAGFAGEDVSVLSPQDRREKHDKGAKAREGAAVGASSSYVSPRDIVPVRGRNRV